MSPTKEDLIALARRFMLDGAPPNETITCTVFSTVKEVTKRLPDWLPLPKIAPSGDGDLLMVWGDENHRAILVVSAWELHLVVKGRNGAETEYVDDIPFFSGSSIPDEILSVLENYGRKSKGVRQ